MTPSRSRLGRAIAAGLLVIGYLVCSMGAATPIAHAASSPGNIWIDPPSGPVGTPVQIGIILNPATPTNYVLSYTPTSPDQGGCATAQPVPGVAPVTVGSDGGGANFSWPSALNQGPYWLCASPASGSGPSAQSSVPYTVISATSPTATTVNTPTPSVSIVTPARQILPGATVTVTVTNWLPADNSAPQTVNLLPQDASGPANGSGFGNKLPFTATAGATGTYTLNVMLPPNTPPATYALQVLGANGLRVLSPSFEVAVPATQATPTTAGQHTTAPSKNADNNTLSLIIAGIVAALLVIAVIILSLAWAARRRSTSGKRPPARW